MNTNSKKYKALMLDVDGVIVHPYDNTLPTKRVQEAINKAKKYLYICLVTARPLFYMNKIFSCLELYSPSVINGGAQVINPENQEILWEKTINYNDLQKTIKVIGNSYLTSIIDNKNRSYQVNEINSLNKAVKVAIEGLSEDEANQLRKKLLEIPNIAAYKSTSFTKNKFSLIISHNLATKKHAISKIKKLLNLKTEEIIGIGDSHNDLPLFASCGLNIAMGNAVDDLKNIAHYVIPSLDKDGVADFLERNIVDQFYE